MRGREMNIKTKVKMNRKQSPSCRCPLGVRCSSGPLLIWLRASGKTVPSGTADQQQQSLRPYNDVGTTWEIRPDVSRRRAAHMPSAFFRTFLAIYSPKSTSDAVPTRRQICKSSLCASSSECRRP